MTNTTAAAADAIDYTAARPHCPDYIREQFPTLSRGGVKRRDLGYVLSRVARVRANKKRSGKGG